MCVRGHLQFKRVVILNFPACLGPPSIWCFSERVLEMAREQFAGSQLLLGFPDSSRDIHSVLAVGSIDGHNPGHDLNHLIGLKSDSD